MGVWVDGACVGVVDTCAGVDKGVVLIGVGRRVLVSSRRRLICCNCHSSVVRRLLNLRCFINAIKTRKKTKVAIHDPPSNYLLLLSTNFCNIGLYPFNHVVAQANPLGDGILSIVTCCNMKHERKTTCA